METLLLLAVLGQVPAVQSIPDEATFELISIESRTRPDVLDATKLLVPASDDPSLLDTVYQNVNLYPFHLDYLRAEHPERFAGTTVEEYRRLVEIRATREYFAGTLQRIRSPDGEILYGFDIYTDVASEEELPLPGEIARVYEEVTATVALGPIVYSPLRTDVIEHVREWEETPFPIYLPDEGIIGIYAAYTRGIAYGTVRALDLATLVELDRTGEISARDIIIVDRPPTDLTSPVAAVITGAPQVELSHLALRLAQRRTPNAFDKALVEGAAPYEGKLVKIEVGSSTAEIRLVDDPAEAEEFWETHRPRLPSLPTFDLSERRIQTLDEIALDPHGGAKYGAKAANLGLLR
ncbi:MAG TPA: hypothetical protein VK116_00105, partial [Planctomycetota bacterium]|nr:hypothetical protein [Planctomycetota bacterium]